MRAFGYAAVLLATVAWSLPACGAPGGAGERYVSHAVAVGEWLRSLETATPDEAPWPDDAMEPDVATADFAGGVAGKVWFFLALHEATGDASYLADIRRGADHLAGALTELVPGDPNRPIAGLYYGLPGACLALQRAAAAAGEPRYESAAASCLARVKSLAIRTEVGVEWSDRFDDLLFGNTGTALYMLEVAERGRDAEAGRLAVEAGRGLVSRMIEDHGGRTWRFRRDAEFILPNFSHGAAGAGLLMIELHRRSGDAAFLAAARAAAGYLDGIAYMEDGAYLVPYGWPNSPWEGLYETGWAHGVAGTARFFHAMWEATGEDRYRDRIAQAARGIELLEAGTLRGDRPPDTRLDMRFGASGVAMFLIDRAAAANDRAAIRALAPRVDAIAASGSRDDTGLRWITSRPAFVERPGEPAAYTGYFTGAAGYGVLMLRYAAALDGRVWSWRLPDDPF